jgi:hypothetical protein
VSRLRKRGPGAIAALDAGIELVTQMPAFLAVLWLSALPSRFVLAAFLVEVSTLGVKAEFDGRSLLLLAYGALLLWLPSLYGRQVFVRACRRAMEGNAAPSWRGLRVPAAELAGAVVAALLVELTFWALSFTLLVPLAMLPAAALAAVAAPKGGPGLFSALREMVASSGRTLSWGLYLLFFFLALLLAALNLQLVFALAVWLVTSVAPIDAPVWAHLVRAGNPTFLAVLGVGATLLVEPFWLATVTVHVAQVRAKASGEDLRQAFEEMRRKTRRDAA